MLHFCANRVMALHELQAIGRMAAGFQRTGCYRCPGVDGSCAYYTPLQWVYASEQEVPLSVAHFIPEDIPPPPPNHTGALPER